MFRLSLTPTNVFGMNEACSNPGTCALRKAPSFCSCVVSITVALDSATGSVPFTFAMRLALTLSWLGHTVLVQN
jgi:hypothetical protein